MSSSTCFLALVLFAMWQRATGTVEYFSNMYGCEVPSTDEIYMGASAVDGTDFSLEIDGAKSEDGVWTISRGQQYTFKLTGEQRVEMIVYFSAGKIEGEEDFELKCDGKQAIVKMLDSLAFRYTPPSEGDTAVVTLGYAPRYTRVRVQKFTIKIEDADSKADL